eukprot:2374341-Prymnesium_polylepis.1
MGLLPPPVPPAASDCSLNPLWQIENEWDAGEDSSQHKWDAGQLVSISFAKWDTGLVTDPERAVSVQFESPDVRVLGAFNADILYNVMPSSPGSGAIVKFHMLEDTPAPHCTPGGKDGDGNDRKPSCSRLPKRTFSFQMTPPSKYTKIICHKPWSPPPSPSPPPPPRPPPPSPRPSPPPPPVTLPLTGCKLGGVIEARDTRRFNGEDSVQIMCTPDEWRGGDTVSVHLKGAQMRVTQITGEASLVSNDARCIGPLQMPTTSEGGATFCFKLVSVPAAFGKATHFSFRVEGTQH